MRVKYQKITRITINAPMSRAQDINNFCNRNGYNIKRSGPKPLKFPKVDVSTYYVIAERVERGKSQ